jgi:serine/threonine-protein kinase
MNPASPCPDSSRLRRLLDASLPEDEQAPLMEHLERCAACRAALESLAAGRDSWEGAARYLRPEETRAEADAGGSGLDFLAPPDGPGQLGRLGHYVVLEEIGRGGMGVVLKARDEVLNRIVAVKVMAPGLAAVATARQRFTREAQAAAAVGHDNVVTIHAVDSAGGLPYLVMQYVHGVSLQQQLDRDGPPALREVLRIGMQTAAGLAAAHAQGVIHRDIKPSNILLENGIQRVKITDFGLARAADDVSLTQSGVVAGTPQYMSPEQALGEPQDHRTDLFSLGSVLYVLCTGRPPFRAETALAVLKRVAEDTPRPVREVNPEVPDWLEAIIGKLMEKHPADRFQSAGEVARLLEGHLAHLQQPARAPLPPPVARRPGPRRNLRPLLLAGVLVLSLSCCLLPLAGMFGYFMLQEHDEAAVGVMSPHGPSGPRAWFTAWSSLWCVALSPDEETVAAGFEDGSVVLWYPVSRQRDFFRREVSKLPVRSVAFTPDGLTLVTGAGDWREPKSVGEVKLWDVDTGKLVGDFPWKAGPVFAVAVSPDGKSVAAGGYVGVKDWDANSKSERPLPPAVRDMGGINALAFAPDSRTLAAGGLSATVQLWDPVTGKEKGSLAGHKDEIEGIRFDPEGRLLASASRDGTARLWDLRTRETRFTVTPSGNGWVRSVAFCGGGQVLAVGAYDRKVRLLDIAGTGRATDFPSAGEQAGAEVASAPKGTRLVTGRRDSYLQLWDVSDAR